jgi:hypothetical protein
MPHSFATLRRLMPLLSRSLRMVVPAVAGLGSLPRPLHLGQMIWSFMGMLPCVADTAPGQCGISPDASRFLSRERQ